MFHEEFARIHIAELMAEAEAERLALTAARAGSNGATRRANHPPARLLAVAIVVLLAMVRLVVA